MNLPTSSEVVIVGGGLLGISTAYQLARIGVEVTIVERNELAREASGTNWGFIWLQTQPADQSLELALASSRMYSTLSDELSFDIEYVQCGGMIAIEGEEDFESAQLVVESQMRAGVDIRLVDRDTMRAMESALSGKLVGAVYSPLDGKVNPLLLTIGLAEGAKTLGARISTGTEVRGIEVRKGQIQSVVTDRGRIKTDTVVNAAGAWAAQIGKMVGVHIPIVCHQGEVVVTEPLPPLVSCLVYSGSCVQDLAKALTGNPGVGQTQEETVSGYGYLQHASGNVILGAGTGHRIHFGSDKGSCYRRIKELANWGTRIIPALKEASMIRSWTGLKAGPVRGAPDGAIIDEVRFGKSRMIVVVDTGHGVACCPMSGKLAAELITLGGDNTSMPIENCRLAHFMGTATRGVRSSLD